MLLGKLSIWIPDDGFQISPLTARPSEPGPKLSGRVLAAQASGKEQAATDVDF